MQNTDNPDVTKQLFLYLTVCKFTMKFGNKKELYV